MAYVRNISEVLIVFRRVALRGGHLKKKICLSRIFYQKMIMHHPR